MRTAWWGAEKVEGRSPGVIDHAAKDRVSWRAVSRRGVAGSGVAPGNPVAGSGATAPRVFFSIRRMPCRPAVPGRKRTSRSAPYRRRGAVSIIPAIPVSGFFPESRAWRNGLEEGSEG